MAGGAGGWDRRVWFSCSSFSPRLWLWLSGCEASRTTALLSCAALDGPFMLLSAFAELRLSTFSLPLLFSFLAAATDPPASSVLSGCISQQASTSKCEHSKRLRRCNSTHLDQRQERLDVCFLGKLELCTTGFCGFTLVQHANEHALVLTTHDDGLEPVLRVKVRLVDAHKIDVKLCPSKQNECHQSALSLHLHRCCSVLPKSTATSAAKRSAAGWTLLLHGPSKQHCRWKS